MPPLLFFNYQRSSRRQAVWISHDEPVGLVGTQPAGDAETGHDAIVVGDYHWKRFIPNVNSA